MFVEIKGVQFVNKGAELMLHAVLQQLKSWSPDLKVVLSPGKNSPYVDRAKVGAYQKLSLSKGRIDLNLLSYYIPHTFRKKLLRYGLVTEADIDVVLDASGFSYGDQWGSNSAVRLASELNRAQARNKKYVFLPQAFGPFKDDRIRKMMAECLPKASLICARDATSMKHIKELGVKCHLKQYPDFTNLVKGKNGDIELPESYVLIIPNGNMISSRNSNFEWSENYILLLSEAISIVDSLGLKSVILNHEGEQDETICRTLFDQNLDKSVFIHENDPLVVKGLIGASDVTICSRFHGCVSALSQSVPCIGTSWSHKYEELFSEYDCSEYLIGADTSASKLEELISQTVRKARDENELVMCFKSQSVDMWAEVVSSLKNE